MCMNCFQQTAHESGNAKWQLWVAAKDLWSAALGWNSKIFQDFPRLSTRRPWKIYEANSSADHVDWPRHLSAIGFKRVWRVRCAPEWHHAWRLCELRAIIATGFWALAFKLVQHLKCECCFFSQSGVNAPGSPQLLSQMRWLVLQGNIRLPSSHPEKKGNPDSRAHEERSPGNNSCSCLFWSSFVKNQNGHHSWMASESERLVGITQRREFLCHRPPPTKLTEARAAFAWHRDGTQTF